MKIYFLTFTLIFLVNCSTNQTKNLYTPQAFDYWSYRNYLDNEDIILSKNIIDNLKPIHFNDLRKNINHQNSSYFELKRKHIFNTDSDSDIRIQMLYVIEGTNNQQFVGYISKLEDTSVEDIYIIFNTIDSKVKSIFVSHESTYNGFGSEDLEVTYKGENLYELKVNSVSDAGARFFEHINCFIITDQGYIFKPVDCKNKKVK